MEKSNRLIELFDYLQDPHLVARFQRFCGVRGTFSGTVCAAGTAASTSSTSSGSSKDAARAHSLNNGVCHQHITAENESENLIGAGEGEKVQTAAGVRKRTADAKVKNHGEESENPPRNGATMPAAAAGGETTGAGSEVTPGRSTLKPLRKNSLTGDTGQEFLIENRFLYYLFTFGTELGNEFFYIVFFPLVIWLVDAFVGRRLIIVWVWVMYLGQCTKDVIGWARPASPPVVKVEMFYNSEYSMPSTHAMSGTAIPFSLFYMTSGRWEYPFLLGFSLALCWCLVVCVSRIYMGMHSVLDVIVGFLYSVLILILFLPVLDLIDGFNLTCRYAPLMIVSLHLGLGLFSFNLDTWSTSRGDTAQILGTGAGVALASHVNHLLGLMPDPTPDQLPLIMPALNARLVAVALLRLILGVLVLVATRALMKALTIPLVCRVFGVPCTDVRKARQHMEVELPYRYIVYGTVGFNVLFLVPLLFSYDQLS
ncbi:sphingosine-1-phosphate phosphatase 1 [Dicentrarchus labrax]|uniref:Sphingosine-1-phosphate phosphatase 1b n=1 Tax=Dicentrarchus labrax TaxID=13489 RepID=A0A8P4KIJ4_DICLA|nr:sphingosine-1-phosphate phosphatase 1 [Dicentrarchus labrax]